MANSTILDIGQVSQRCGLPPSTLRYYEEKGLIHSVGRKGLKRLFTDSVLQRLEFIALGRIAGFSLDELAEMLLPDGGYRIDREQLRQRANEIDAKIQQLSAVRDGLRHAADCSAPSHQACDKFQRLLNAAGKSQVKKAKSR